MSLRLRDAAEADIGDAHAWYDDRGHELGDQFLAEVDHCLESVGRNPLAFPAVHGEIRRALLRRFPYCIFYIVAGRNIVVLACLHGHRDPRTWQSRRDT